MTIKPAHCSQAKPEVVMRGYVRLLTTCVAAMSTFLALAGCSEKRSVNSRPLEEYRLYAVGGGTNPPLYYIAVDDTSYRLIDSIPAVGGVFQLEVSLDGHSLYVGRTVEGESEIVQFDVGSKSVVGVFADERPGLFALSGTGDTILVSCHSSADFCLLDGTGLSLLDTRNLKLPDPSTALRKPLIGSVTAAVDSIVVVYDYELDSVISRAICRGLDGRAYIAQSVSIDPNGERLYVTAYRGNFRVLVIDIASWTTIAEFPMLSRFGRVAFGKGGSPVFLPDPGSFPFNYIGLIYVISPHSFDYIDTLKAEGPPCRVLPRPLGKLVASPKGERVFAIRPPGFGRAPIMVIDSKTSEIDWISLPNTCDDGFLTAAVGPSPD